MDWTNPLPFMVGGGLTDIQAIWLSLRAATGGEHGPGEAEGIDDLARQARATCLAGALHAVERAFLQAFPDYATDALPVWDALLQSDGANTDPELRALLRLLWLPPNGSTTPHLTADLTDISSQLSIDLEDDDETIVTLVGKHLQPTDDDPTYGIDWPPGGLMSAVRPNFASRDVLRIVYTLDATTGEVEIPANVSRDVTKLLHRRLPSHQTWTLVQELEGGSTFLLDGGDHGESVLDVTPLG